MATSVAWYPDPTGRYSHRWWDGQAWTSRVYANGTVVEDQKPVAVPTGQKLYCGVCHATLRSRDWTSRCARCTIPLTSAYIATKPRRELKPADLLQAAHISFEDVLADVDRTLANGDECAALRRLDTAIAYGKVLRAVAASVSSTASAKTRRPEPLALSALLQVHLQAVRLHAGFAATFDPAAFELTLLLRLAALYAVDGEDELPDTPGELIAFCASRVEWVEAECPAVNDAAAGYASAYEWMSLQVALARIGYEVEDKRRAGKGLFEPGEHGRLEAAALLGVDADGHPTQIKKAYYRAAAQHHPDRLAEAPDEVRIAAEERMKEINAAYELLTA